MISASDLIDVHPADGSADQERRVVALIGAIANLDKDGKEKLAKDLLTIAGSPGEKTLRRVQAARTLAHQARRLDIVGSTAIANRILRTLKEEFIPEQLASGSSAAHQSAGLLSLNGMEIFLFEYLVYGVFVIDRTAGVQLADVIGDQLQGTELGNTILTLWKRAQRETL